MAGRRAPSRRAAVVAQTPKVSDAQTQRALDVVTEAVKDLQARRHLEQFTATEPGYVPEAGTNEDAVLHADGVWREVTATAIGAVTDVTAGSSKVTVAPTTGSVVVDVVPANFTGIPMAGISFVGTNNRLAKFSGTTLADTTITDTGILVTINNALNVTGTADFDSSLLVNSTLTVNGAVDFDTTLNVDGAVSLNSTLGVAGNATLGDDTTVDTHTVNGSIAQIGRINGSAFTATLDASSMTANNAAAVRGFNSSTVDTSGGVTNAAGMWAQVTATRVAGASTLCNIGLFASATNGTLNEAIRTDDGRVLLNRVSGDTLVGYSSGTVSPAKLAVNGTFHAVGNATIGGTLAVTGAITGYVPDSRTISTTAPLAGGGNLSANRTFSLNDNGITDAKLRDSAALSVIGRSANSLGDPADIAAGSDGHVLRRSGTTLGFGTIPSTSVTGLITSIVAGTNLSGGGSSGAVTVNVVDNPSFAGNVTLGDASSDSHTINGSVTIADADADAGFTVNNTGTGGRSFSVLSTSDASGVPNSLLITDNTAGGALRFRIDSSGNISGNGSWTLGDATSDSHTANGKFTINTTAGGQCLVVQGSTNGLNDGQFKVVSHMNVWGNITGQFTTTAGGSTTTDNIRLSIDSGFIALRPGNGTDALTIAHGGGATFASDLTVNGNTRLGNAAGDTIGFYTTAGAAQQTVTGSRGGNAALADLLTKLATLGLIVDGTSA